MKHFPVLLLAAIVIVSSAGERQHVFHHENVLGTSLELKVAAATPAAARRAQSVALAEIDRQAKILSGYDPGSEFGRWMNTRYEAATVSKELFEVLSRFDRYRVLTNGALDPAAEAVSRVWKSAAAAQRLPEQAEIQAAVTAVQGPNWRLDPVHHTATRLTDTPLILNSFTKSYIAGRAADAALSQPEVMSVVVNIGGDLVVRGSGIETVNIVDPRNDAENAEPVTRINVRDRAVATSGNYRRRVKIGDRFYSHIVDPRTGRPVDHILSSTVVSPDPSDAGALATAFSVLTPEESSRVASSVPGVEYLLIASDGRRFSSPGWNKLGAALAPPQQSTPQVEPGQWDTNFELAITLELPAIKGARRPYVAAWIEDKDRFPVRTIELWVQKPKYIPELRSWYRADRTRKSKERNDIMASVSGATRPAGKYTLKWDGKDNAGNLVKAGGYTVNIEAAREHGTHQVLRQEMEFKGTPSQIILEGGTEIASASLDYRRITH